MENQTISITCKYRSGTYVTSKFNGQTASSTQGPEFAVRALAFKLLPDQKFTVVNTGKEYWEIHKSEEIKEQPKFQTIQFVDKGQDFLEWIVRDGIVIDCQPFQFTIWTGGSVQINDDQVFYKPKNKTGVFPLKPLIDTITTTHPDYVAGYEDGLINQENENASTSEQYQFGYRAAVYMAGKA
ncbi:hypothetical protein [Rheinheimera baltica]|uniref:hypothetical protein n=1 Tax=Rheinheimera baltica TaxID=67576 RepID=UPI0004010286|nr:hypothetical protein [Rheinheimera baltica]